jgi:pyruvate,orthophosphate dikinase
MQDIEFTIQEGHLWMLQCRIGKRTGLAALQMAMDMVDEKMIDEKTAVMRVSPSQLEELLHPILDPASEKKSKVLAIGLPASPGGAVGQIVFTSEAAMEASAKGKKTILIREETSPEDIEGMRAAASILTQEIQLAPAVLHTVVHVETYLCMSLVAFLRRHEDDTVGSA